MSFLLLLESEKEKVALQTIRLRGEALRGSSWGTGPPQSQGPDYDSPTVAKSRTACPQHPKMYLTCLISSIKGEVKRKNLPNGWNFSSFAAHVNEQGLF
jgi:hypothetical protein